MKKKNNVFLIILVITALFTMFIFGANDDGHPDYTVFSRESGGAGLLYDTLNKMGYNVNIWYAPINANTGIHDAYVLIMPNIGSQNEIDDIIAWVKRGGQMIYLRGTFPDYLELALSEHYYENMGGFSYYHVGLGNIITGNANWVVNTRLMEDPSYGSMLAGALNSWAPNQIRFAEYYHGYGGAENTFSTLPGYIKLAAYQMVFITILVVWHFGKRFGKPIPYYEETERMGDEYVKALSRLYLKSKNLEV